MYKSIIIILISAFVLSGCSILPESKIPAQKPIVKEPAKPVITKPGETSGQTIKEQLAGQSEIKKFASLDELQEFLEVAAVSTLSYSRGMVGMGVGFAEEMVSDSMAAPQAMMKSETSETLSARAGMGGASDDFSKTNVQVAGVDEADIIKTDGKYIYAVVQNNLYIVQAYPVETAAVLTKIEFKSRPQDIYINDDYLAVYGADDVFYNTDLYSRFRRRGSFTFFKVFDITDRKNPKQVRDLDFEGNYSNSRMIGDWVYFVTTNYNYYYIEDEPVLPRLLADGAELPLACSDGAKCIMPDMYYFNIPYSSYNFTSVTAINVRDAEAALSQDVYLMSANQNMYVSKDNMYITYTKYVSEYQLETEVMKEIIYPRLSAKNQEKIAKIEQAENYILSPEEKMRKIGEIIESYASSLTDEEQRNLEVELEAKMKQKYEDISKELEKTVIHKIAISEGNLEYQTFGEVTGQVLNQFSMDESKGYFRIATTKNRTWSRYDQESQESYNNMYVLDKDMQVVGAVENLAEGERIYSVRFMGDRAYMVTFKQMDPLFAIDLSDPRNPKILGELKIPGFSNYLHPYDENILIGFGKDTGESEWGGVQTKGLKLSLFDVSDVSDLKEIDTYIMGDAGSDSIALNDHKAFLFDREKNLLSIPVSIRESLGSRGWGNLTFSGAAVLTVDEKGFTLKGKIDHSDGGRPSSEDYWGGYQYWDNTVKRSLYIDDVLYTFSNNYLKMNKLSDLELVKKLELKKNASGSNDDFKVIN